MAAKATQKGQECLLRPTTCSSALLLFSATNGDTAALTEADNPTKEVVPHRRQLNATCAPNKCRAAQCKAFSDSAFL